MPYNITINIVKLWYLLVCHCLSQLVAAYTLRCHNSTEERCCTVKHLLVVGDAYARQGNDSSAVSQ